jgi:hypothetical protein
MYQKGSALVGTVTGSMIAGGSYLLLIPDVLFAMSIFLLYSVGVFLLIDHIRFLRIESDNGGSWWVIAFGGMIGLALIVLQEVYTPVEVFAEGALNMPTEEVATLSIEFTLMLYLFVFSIALVSLNIGLGMALADFADD